MADNDRYFSAELHGMPLVRLALGSQSLRRREQLKEILNDAADKATAEMRIYAPVGETGYLHEHLHRSGMTYLPGGAGGGGTYQIVTGVRRGTSQHPFFVHGGTANRDLDTMTNAAVLGGGGGANLQGRIYARGGMTAKRYQLRVAQRGTKDPILRRPALTFQKQGEPRRFRAWVRGQRPQPFVYFAFQTTAIYVERRLAASGRSFA